MTQTIIFTFSAGVAYFAHEVAEWFLKRRASRQIRLIIKGRHIHHSFFGALTIIFALAFLSGGWAIIFFGYGLGNIWQHKITHNRVSEKGLVFITRVGQQLNGYL